METAGHEEFPLMTGFIKVAHYFIWMPEAKEKGRSRGRGGEEKRNKDFRNNWVQQLETLLHYKSVQNEQDYFSLNYFSEATSNQEDH